MIPNRHLRSQPPPGRVNTRAQEAARLARNRGRQQEALPAGKKTDATSNKDSSDGKPKAAAKTPQNRSRASQNARSNKGNDPGNVKPSNQLSKTAQLAKLTEHDKAADKEFDIADVQLALKTVLKTAKLASQLTSSNVTKHVEQFLLTKFSVKVIRDEDGVALAFLGPRSQGSMSYSALARQFAAAATTIGVNDAADIANKFIDEEHERRMTIQSTSSPSSIEADSLTARSTAELNLPAAILNPPVKPSSGQHETTDKLTDGTDVPKGSVGDDEDLFYSNVGEDPIYFDADDDPTQFDADGDPTRFDHDDPTRFDYDDDPARFDHDDDPFYSNVGEDTIYFDHNNSTRFDYNDDTTRMTAGPIRFDDKPLDDDMDGDHSSMASDKDHIRQQMSPDSDEDDGDFDGTLLPTASPSIGAMTIDEEGADDDLDPMDDTADIEHKGLSAKERRELITEMAGLTFELAGIAPPEPEQQPDVQDMGDDERKRLGAPAETRFIAAPDSRRRQRLYFKGGHKSTPKGDIDISLNVRRENVLEAFVAKDPDDKHYDTQRRDSFNQVAARTFEHYSQFGGHGIVIHVSDDDRFIAKSFVSHELESRAPDLLQTLLNVIWNTLADLRRESMKNKANEKQSMFTHLKGLAAGPSNLPQAKNRKKSNARGKVQDKKKVEFVQTNKGKRSSVPGKVHSGKKQQRSKASSEM